MKVDFHFVCKQNLNLFFLSILSGADSGSSKSEDDRDKETNVSGAAADPGPYFGFGISKASSNIRSSLWLVDLSACLVLSAWYCGLT